MTQMIEKKVTEIYYKGKYKKEFIVKVCIKIPMTKPKYQRL